MDEYEKLLKDLRAIVRKKGKVTLNELLEWSESNNVGVVTLALLVEDLKREETIEASPEEEVLDPHLGISVPKFIELKYGSERSTERRGKRKAVRISTKRKRKRLERSGTLLEFLLSEEEEEKTREDAPPIRQTLETKREKKTEISSRGKRFEPTSEIAEQHVPTPSAPDQEMFIALQYLSRYWSVGELRLLSDLKEMGVSNPERVLRQLIEEGIVTRTDVGVLNADRDKVKELLRKMPSRTTLTTKSLIDLFTT